MFDQTVNFVTHTNGRGHWSTVSGCVKIDRVRIAYLDDELDFGELRAYFDRAEWNTDKDGLIYTDPTWIESFRNCMATLGFSEAALQDIDYSEAGMQGSNYVSMDVGGDFVRECEALHRFVINRQAVNS
jgi:hypothetical protein